LSNERAKLSDALREPFKRSSSIDLSSFIDGLSSH
jgi:hypothetical protein